MSGIWEALADTFLQEDGPRCGSGPGTRPKPARSQAQPSQVSVQEAYAAGFVAGQREGSFFGSGVDGYGGHGASRHAAGAPRPSQPSTGVSPLSSQILGRPPRPPSPLNLGQRRSSVEQRQEPAGGNSTPQNPLQWIFGAEQASSPTAPGVAYPGSGVTNFGSGVSSSYVPPQSGAQASRNNARRRAPRDPVAAAEVDKKDTAIGKGFGAQLRKGLAQAEKQAEESSKRTEMVPQGDGGFIATVQKGFMGMFGHVAMTKEEVLRKRGPMLATEYEAVPGDDIDQKVQYLARWLPPSLAGDLKIFRAAKGQYQIGDEEVELKWHEWVRPDGVHCREVFVFMRKDDENDAKQPFEPLPLYLQHSASVAHNLKNGHAITQVPKEERMSFSDVRGTHLLEANGEQRFKAMELASEQAKLREKAAMDWRSRKTDSKDLDSSDGGTTATPGGSVVISERDSTPGDSRDSKTSLFVTEVSRQGSKMSVVGSSVAVAAAPGAGSSVTVAAAPAGSSVAVAAAPGAGSSVTVAAAPPGSSVTVAAAPAGSSVVVAAAPDDGARKDHQPQHFSQNMPPQRGLQHPGWAPPVAPRLEPQQSAPQHQQQWLRPPAGLLGPVGPPPPGTMAGSVFGHQGVALGPVGPPQGPCFGPQPGTFYGVPPQQHMPVAYVR